MRQSSQHEATCQLLQIPVTICNKQVVLKQEKQHGKIDGMCILFRMKMNIITICKNRYVITLFYTTK